jgi:hypothetical protein
MTIVSKTHIAVANQFNQSVYKISQERQQNIVKRLITKLAYLLHNIFINGSFNDSVSDDSIQNTVLQVSKKVKLIINQYENNPEKISELLQSEKITFQENLDISVEFKLEGGKLNVYLTEQEHVNGKREFYFPKTEKLLSINLSKSKVHLKNMAVVQQQILQRKCKVLKKSEEVIKDITTVMNYDDGKWFSGNLRIYLNNFFMQHKDDLLNRHTSKRYAQAVEELSKNPDQYDGDLMLRVNLFFLQYDAKSTTKKEFIVAAKRLGANDIFKAQGNDFENLLDVIQDVYCIVETSDEQRHNIRSLFTKIAIINLNEEGKSLIFE